MNFFVTLPSNSSMETFPNNTQSSYTTILSSPIELNLPYEVALVEMSYCTKLGPMPNKYKVTIQNTIFTHPWSSKEISFEVVLEDIGKLDFKQRFLKYLQHLIIETAVNDELRIFFDIMDGDFRSYYLLNDKNGTTYAFKNDDQYIYFGPGVSQLSFKSVAAITKFPSYTINSLPNVLRGTGWVIKPEVLNNVKVHEDISVQDINGNKMARDTFIKKTIEKYINKNLFEFDLNENFVSIKSKDNKTLKTIDLYKDDDLTFSRYAFVYTDIIEDQYVGDVKAKCLKTCILKSDKSLLNENSVTNPHYLRNCKTNISSINIEIRDTTGEKIKFNNTSTQTIIKIHFRPIV